MQSYAKETYARVDFTKTVSIRSLFSAFEEIYPSDHYFNGESHNFWEFVCVLDGCVGVTADDNVYMLHKNQIILHPPLEFHKIWSAQGTSPHVVIMSFSADKMPPISEYIYQVGEDAQRFIIRLAAEAEQLFLYTGEGIYLRRAATQTAVEIFQRELEKFLLSILSGTSLVDNSDQSEGASRYRRIIQSMERNITRRLSVDELAKDCGMSKSNLKKIFSQYCGEGIIKHFNDMKIKAAIPMLLEGKSVAEVSLHFGFDEQSYFSTVFKRITGYSPVNYVKWQGNII